MDYRRMYDDNEMLYARDLEDFAGQDAVFQIKSVSAGELTGQKGRKTKKPFITFHDPDGKLHGKKLAANKTNGKSIAKMYGKDATKWIGQWVAMYCTTVDYDGEVTDCIRIRPSRPEVQRPAQNGKAGASVNAAPALIALFDECSDMDRFLDLEKRRAAVWGKLSKDDKILVKSAVDDAQTRINASLSAPVVSQLQQVATDSPLSADEQVEIARLEAQGDAP